MKFPRNSNILRSQFDFAPYATVFFLIAIFVMLGQLITAKPGYPLQLPIADNLPGTSAPTVSVAVDSTDRLYFQNQMVTERQLKSSLSETVRASHKQLTLVIDADKSVTYEQLSHLILLARSPGIGITNVLLATLPTVTEAPVLP